MNRSGYAPERPVEAQPEPSGLEPDTINDGRPGPKKLKRIGANVVAPPPEGVRLYSFGQAAYLLQVSVTTVRRLADEGQIRSAKVGKRIFISREAIDDFIRAADTRKVATSEVSAQQAAEAARLRGEQRRTKIVAEWSQGRDLLGLEKYRAMRKAKANKKASGA